MTVRALFKRIEWLKIIINNEHLVEITIAHT
ncbi:MAG: hypothetical protein ACI9VL_001858 [Colwellia sp.]